MKKVLDRLPGCAKWGSDTGPRCGSPGLGGGGGWPAPVTGPGVVQQVGQKRASGVPRALVALFTPARSRQIPPEVGPRSRETRGQAMVAGGYNPLIGPVGARLSTGAQRRTQRLGRVDLKIQQLEQCFNKRACAFRGRSRYSRQIIRRGDQVPHPPTRQ
jgi:hypothetical protein